MSLPLLRIIGSMKDLNEDEELGESYVEFDALVSKLTTLPAIIHRDISIEVDGASPIANSLDKANNRNGYVSKQFSFNREFSFTTRRLFNHNSNDVAIMEVLDIIHTFPFHYFTFWMKNEYGTFISTHKSALGKYYFTPAGPGFVVATFETPSIKNNHADANSEFSAHRIYSWKATEWGIRSIKNIVGG